MSILARLIAPGANEQRTLQTSAFVPPPQVGVIDDFVGVHRAMANMTVWGCVRLLADTIASLPWKAFRRDSNNVPVEIKPTPMLLRTPWPGFDLFQYKWMMVAAMALRGNFYGMITSRNNLGFPTSLLPLHPDLVFLERNADPLMWFTPTYRVMGQAIDPPSDMMHMRRFTMPGEPWGLSPVKQAAVAIGMSLSAEEYGYRYFKESANPSGLLSTEQDLDEDAVARQQKNWIASHGGRRLPAVLTGGFKWQHLSIRPDEAQFLETRQFQRSEICLMYGVPPILIGDTKETTAWGTGVAQITQGAVTYTFRPWTTCMESVLSGCLPGGQYVRFDYDALLRTDPDQRFAQYKTGITSGFLMPNEARAMEEREPVPGGDILLQPANVVPLGYPPAATNPQQPPGQPGQTPKVPSEPTAGGEDDHRFNGVYFQENDRDEADADNTNFRLT